MSTKGRGIMGRNFRFERGDLRFEQGDLVRFNAPGNMSYIVMVTKDVMHGDDQFNGVTLTTNGLNLIGEYSNNYVTEQFTKFTGTIQITSE